MEFNSIFERMFFNTVKISTWNSAGSEGAGTGFYFQIKRDGEQVPFIVSNKHVIENASYAKLSFHKNIDGKPSLTDKLVMEFNGGDWQQMWFGHPDPDIDIAVCPLAPIATQFKRECGDDLFFVPTEPTDIPSPEQIRELDAIEDVTFVGYPNGVRDSKNLLPVIRRGSTASPLQVDFEGTPRFIIDASVFGGSSGSPVYIAQSPYHDKRGNLYPGTKFFFVGVVAAVFFRTSFNQIVQVPIPTAVNSVARQQEMIDLGVVFKASTVMQTISYFITNAVAKGKMR